MDTETLIATRHTLHTKAELSREERGTSEFIAQRLSTCAPRHLFRGVGGHGVVAAFDSGRPGPRILLRADMDALPIPESIPLTYRSESASVSHKCGHDGHMTILLGVATELAVAPRARGSVTLLFQPAEETGAGAAATLTHPSLDAAHFDCAFALHNIPGFPLGTAVVREGTFASASAGVEIRLTGSTSHASEPQNGRSPALAMASLINYISSLAQFETALHENTKATVTHARLGEPAFGTSPGEAIVTATLRSYDSALLEHLKERLLRYGKAVSDAHGLTFSAEIREPFPATVNDALCIDHLRKACSAASIPTVDPGIPFPWSEDFGHFTRRFPGALFGLGSGESHPALHSPSYDFPDALLPQGVALFMHLLRHLQGA